MDSGEDLTVEAKMVDYSKDPWQEITIFLTPEIIENHSLALVQDRLEKLPAGSEARVPVSSPFVEAEELGHLAGRPLNPALGGSPFTLFPFGTTPLASDAVITHSEPF